MDSYPVALASAIWLGILTSISPCPLATNIAAITYIGKRVDRPRMVFLSGFMYVLGRMVTYLVLGVLIVASILSIPDLAWFLQKYMNKFLGPVLIVAGLFLLEIIRIGTRGRGLSERVQNRVARYGVWGAGLFGIIFALSFCPVSAALFFGSLIPLSVQHNSSLLFPSVYGLGTGLPVIVFAFLIALGTGYIGRVFDRLTQFEKWARRITGAVFILVGVYYTLVYILMLDIGF